MSSAPPPPQFAEYPRAIVDPTAADRLEALKKGYFNLSILFIGHAVLAIATILCAGVSPWLYLAALIVLFVLVMYFSLPLTKAVGFGLGWSSTAPIIASVCLFLFGIISYAVVQSMAAAGMKKLGVKRRFLGIRKKDVDARIAEIRGP